MKPATKHAATALVALFWILPATPALQAPSSAPASPPGQTAPAQGSVPAPSSAPAPNSEPAKNDSTPIKPGAAGTTLNPAGQSKLDAAHPATKSPHKPGAWLKKHQALPTAEQLRVLEDDPGYKSLSPTDQQIMRNSLQRFASSSPEQRQKLINRLRAFEALTPAQKQLARQSARGMRQLPEPRKAMVKKALNDMMNLTPDQRELRLKSPDLASTFSAGEIDLLHTMVTLRSYRAKPAVTPAPVVANPATPPAR